METAYDAYSDDDKSDGNSLFSRSSPVEGHENWRASPPPEEIFGDGEWQFQIIGEEVNHEGNIQYEVRWDDWHREDGTNTTWETTETIADTNWKTTQQKQRRNLANESLEIDVITTADIHNTATYLRSQAYDEKLKRALSEPKTDPFVEMANLLGKNQEHVQSSVPARIPVLPQGTQGSSLSPFPLRTNQRATTRQQTENSLASSSTLVRGSSKLSASSSVTLSSSNLKSLSVSSSASSLPASSKTSSSKTTHAHVTLATTAARSKGKGKQVDLPPQNLKHNNPIPNQRSRSSSSTDMALLIHRLSNTKGKGKRVVPPTSDEESEDSMYAVPPRLENTPPSSGRPFVLLTSRKKYRRIIKSESADELLIPSCPSPQPARSIRIGPPSKVPRVVETPATRRKKLSEKWTSYAIKEGGASIQFVNEVDDEAIPNLDPSFHYLECAYEFAPGIQKPDQNFLVSCSCHYCFEPQHCDCQAPSDLVNENGFRIFAYSPSGLFAFTAPKGMEVIECNKHCTCSLYQCVNRVSQRPRATPIEIFKTETRGWGVRTTTDVQRGKILGIYTGLVVRRDDAEVIPPELGGYRFDLDGDETEDHEPDHPAYSVDSRVHGNWTRFINHSCSPNLQIYLVVHDTPPNTGLPYIAFVAGEDIPARTEFTLDYDPKAFEKQAIALAKGKGRADGKGKQSSSIPENSHPCRCGSEQCRGYIAY